MKTIEFKFVNELGNTITMTGVLGDTSVTVSVEGPTSTSTNTLTRQEGRMLTSLMASLFPEALPDTEDD